jgi:hypothetical protein
MKRGWARLPLAHVVAILVSVASCGPQTRSLDKITVVDRETQIPAGAEKITPENDAAPPEVYSSEYEKPVPVPGEVNTAGAEDSPFITPDGDSLYFVFTPDVSIPLQKQLLDGVTGIYVSRKVSDTWTTPARIVLQAPAKLSLDGCEFVQSDVMWFCSAREGYDGMHWFTAEQKNGKWQNWKSADFPSAYQVGELHITDEGNDLYFHSDRPGGQGGLDIWVSHKVKGAWQEPQNVAAVNTPDAEGWPALSPDGEQLWFYRNWSVWRSLRVNGEWQKAELVVSPLAGEPSLDKAGNLYFVHHFYKNNKMIEADIYVAYKK